MQQSLRLGRAFALALLATGLVACKKHDEPAATVTPPPASAAAPATVTAVETGKAIGADRKVTAPTAAFGAKDTIYVSIATTGSNPQSTLVANWTFQDGQTVSSDTQTVALNGPANTEFHISKPDGFPRGNYNVAVTLNGVGVGNKAFTVN